MNFFIGHKVPLKEIRGETRLFRRQRERILPMGGHVGPAVTRRRFRLGVGTIPKRFIP